MAVNSPRQVLFASLIGTTIEFFDFYIYATAAVLVFPKLFFPGSDPAAATLESLATFGIAFLARPVGSALFGHFGDRIGRKTTLVIALSAMGISTVAIGALPTYRTIGFAAPLLLALCRFGQGLGLGGEWGGAVLLAIENAPPHKRAWYGMFPQLGAPAGFLLSGGTFLLLSRWLTDKQFFSFGWRLPFLASAVLVFLGLYVRLTITETPVFREALSRGDQVKVPMLSVFRDYTKALVAGILVSLATFVLFYLMTVFALSWGTNALGYSRSKFLVIQLIGICFFALFIPVSAVLAERGRRRVMLGVTVAIAIFGLVLAPLFIAGTTGAMSMMILGLSLDGPYLRTAGHSYFGTLSYPRALHREFTGLQLCRYPGRLTGAVHRDLAGQALWSAICRLLSFRSGGFDSPGAAFDPGDERRRSGYFEHLS